MECYRVHVDGRVSYVRQSKESLRAEMHEYVRQELDRGRALRNIEFCYVPIRYQVYASKAERS